MPNGELSPVVPKREQSREDLVSPLGSLHEDDIQNEGRLGAGLNADGSPVLKRKGGRKPLYATTEERKQRNRRAQAAFRERRTEHIKQLESDITHMQDTVKSLEQSQQRAKDECLMLRYKNSLLENLLLQKNIDFQKEIQQSGLSYSPQQVPRNSVPLHRTIHQQRMRPAPINVGNQSPLASGTQSASNASPVQAPLSSAFTFTHQGYPQPSSQPPVPPSYAAGPRPSAQAGQIPSALSSPTATLHAPAAQQWNVGAFQAELDPDTSSFVLEPEAMGQPNVSSAGAMQGQQYQNLNPSHTQQQFGLLAQGQYAQTQPNIGQVLDQGTHAQASLGHQQGQLSTGMSQQEFNLMGHDMSGFGLSDGDPFGIDRSMHYPTQFDFQNSQRRQQ